MPNPQRKRCLVCRRHESEVGPISWAGYCAEHGKAIKVEAMDAMHYHRGPIFDKWRRSMAASVGGVLVDDLLDAE